MPRYKIDGQYVYVYDLSLRQLHFLWTRYKRIQERAVDHEQWALCCIAMDEIVKEVLNNPSRKRPKRNNRDAHERLSSTGTEKGRAPEHGD